MDHDTTAVLALAVGIALLVLLVRDVRAIRAVDAAIRAELAAGVTYIWRKPDDGDGYLERVPAPSKVVAL